MKLSPEKKQRLYDSFYTHFIMVLHWDEKDSKQHAQWMSDMAEKDLRSFSDAVAQNVEEMNLDDPHFNGVAYEKDIDQKALKSGFWKVFAFLAEHHEWYTDYEISDATGVYIPSVSRYRSNCREAEWGGHIVERQRREGCRIFEYRLIVNKESLTYNRYLEQHAQR